VAVQRVSFGRTSFGRDGSAREGGLPIRTKEGERRGLRRSRWARAGIRIVLRVRICRTIGTTFFLGGSARGVTDAFRCQFPSESLHVY
jgi:hypothetical protein